MIDETDISYPTRREHCSSLWFQVFRVIGIPCTLSYYTAYITLVYLVEYSLLDWYQQYVIVHHLPNQEGTLVYEYI